MRQLSITLIFLLVTATPAFAAGNDVHGRGSVIAFPLPDPLLGASLELSHDQLRLGLVAEAATRLAPVPRVWATWLRWTPWGSEGFSYGVLAGYNQSYALFPGPGIVSPDGRDSRWEMPGALLGFTCEWSHPTWWLRLSPHVGVGYDQFWRLDPTFRSIFLGPPMAEIGWQPMDHVEVGLRLSITPVRIGFRF